MHNRLTYRLKQVQQMLKQLRIALDNLLNLHQTPRNKPRLQRIAQRTLKIVLTLLLKKLLKLKSKLRTTRKDLQRHLDKHRLPDRAHKEHNNRLMQLQVLQEPQDSPLNRLLQLLH